jgi:hypothetical protein
VCVQQGKGAKDRHVPLTDDGQVQGGGTEWYELTLEGIAAFGPPANWWVDVLALYTLAIRLMIAVSSCVWTNRFGPATRRSSMLDRSSLAKHARRAT